MSVSNETFRFYRVGGDNRIAGFLLAVATGALLVIGSAPIAFIRERHKTIPCPNSRC